MPFSFLKARRSFFKNIVYVVSAVVIPPFIERAHAKSTTTNTELDNCLSKAIDQYNVRDMLTKFGISDDAKITLEIKIGDNSPIASCSVPNVPITAKNKSISSGSMSLESLHESLIEDFINPGISDLDLMKFIAGVGGAIDNDKNKLTIGLNSQCSKSSINLALRGCCCCRRSNGNCCKTSTNCNSDCCPCRRN